jgi:hypothetical protein
MSDLQQKLEKALSERNDARESRDNHKELAIKRGQERDQQLRENERLVGVIQSLNRQVEALAAVPPPPPPAPLLIPPGRHWPPPEPPTYFADYLAVWEKTVRFTRDERFQKAYRLGMQSGHLFCPPDMEDLHIEWRVHVALWAALHGAQLEGDFVECGVNTGMMSVPICDYLEFNRLNKKFWLFDTYEGIPVEQMSAQERAMGREKLNAVYPDCFERAKANFSRWPGAILVRGRVPDTLKDVSIERVSYLSIDMNIVEPEIAALHHFWPKLSSGAIVLLDDYGWNAHQLQADAMDEFARGVGVPILSLPTSQAVMIKP